MYRVLATCYEYPEPIWFQVNRDNFAYPEGKGGYYTAGELFPVEHPDNQRKALEWIERDKNRFIVVERGTIGVRYLYRFDSEDQANWHRVFKCYNEDDYATFKVGDFVQGLR